MNDFPSGEGVVDFSTRLGALRCATILCKSVEQASSLYAAGLGYRIVEQGVVSPERAANWSASATAGAAFAVLGPQTDETTYIRFIEDPAALSHVPYATSGWAALEFSVSSSDVAVERLSQLGFEVVGPAQDLVFSAGALRAGQVSGPFGEILYLTQVNAQLDGYTLPVAAALVDKMFIVIMLVPNVADACDIYAARYHTRLKDTFDAEVPFIAAYQGLPRNTMYHFGCVEMVPRSYIELDEMPTCVPRPCGAGGLPSGIAMVSFEVPSIAPFRSPTSIAAAADPSLPYSGGESLTLIGPNGELIEIIEAAQQPRT